MLRALDDLVSDEMKAEWRQIAMDVPGAQALAQWLDSGVLAQALARQLQAEVPHAA